MGTSETTLKIFNQENSTLTWKAERLEVTMNPARGESEVVSSEGRVVTAGSQQIEGKSMELLQVNCRIILNKTLQFWNLVDTYDPDVIIGTES